MGAPTQLVEGHSANVFGLCVHPTAPHVYCSGSEDGEVLMWDSLRRECVRSLSVRPPSLDSPLRLIPVTGGIQG